ncbi:MAG: hypothetical protein HYU80_01460 [Candidatus Blackburnbacteria bacterium]|nr:hypothetical protein [Candidatus Blackburnbacteria bacterium]
MYKTVTAYFKKHVLYNSLVHVLGGVGVGILVARPYVTNPVRWGLGLLVISIVAHLYPLLTKSSK